MARNLLGAFSPDGGAATVTLPAPPPWPPAGPMATAYTYPAAPSIASQSQMQTFPTGGGAPPAPEKPKGFPWLWGGVGAAALAALAAAAYFGTKTKKGKKRRNPKARSRRRSGYEYTIETKKKKRRNCSTPNPKRYTSKKGKRLGNPKGLKWQAGTNYGEIRARHKKSKTLYEVTNFGEGLLSVYEPGQPGTTIGGAGIGSLVRMAEADRPGRRRANPKRRKKAKHRKPTRYEKRRARPLKRKRNLAATTRSRLPARSFAIPERRAYPIQSRKQAKKALGFLKRFGKRRDRKRVRKAVFSKYPVLRRKR